MKKAINIDFAFGIIDHYYTHRTVDKRWKSNREDDIKQVLTELVEEVEKDKRKAINAAKAYQELCTHYRIGKTPSEKLFKRLDAANMFLKQIEKELEESHE